MTQSGLDVLRVDLSWPTSAADDLDLVVYWVDPNGRRVEVGSSGNAPGQAESAKVVDQQSVYVERGQQVKLDLKECSRKWKSTL